MPRWRIGELAAATGLTVRTLHHYEQVGLLAPAGRTDSQHRRYDEADVQRLYRICALRELGLSLAEIGEVLDQDGGAIGAVLRVHLARAEEEISRLTRVRARLLRLCEAEAEVKASDLLDVIDAISRVERHVEKRQRARPGPSGAEAAWRALGDALRQHMDAGEAPGSAEVQGIAMQVQEKIRAFAGHDPATLDALAVVRRVSPPASLAGWDPALMRYLDAALEHLNNADPTKENS